MAKKETFLSKIRGDSSISLNEEEMLRKELLDLKMSLASGKLKEIHKIKKIRIQMSLVVISHIDYGILYAQDFNGQ